MREIVVSQRAGQGSSAAIPGGRSRCVSQGDEAQSRS